METRTWKVAGVNFDHMHMGDLLRLVHEHPHAEIVGLADATPSRMETAGNNFGIPPERRYLDFRLCIEETRPDIVLLCPKTGEHGDYVEWVAPYGVHVLVEKPMAASLADADRMIAAMQATGKTLVINWPLAWYPPHVTTQRLIEEGVIGEVREVHYYDGNRGPLRHVADKQEISAEEAARQKSQSWWYQKEAGGGSLLDYLGYGVTLGTWFHGGRAPIEVTSVVDETPGLEVDEHSVTIARYDVGLSKFETRWGAFTDPWTLQPQPKCGFVVVGTAGTISSYDYEPIIHLQTHDHPETHEFPVDRLQPPYENPVQYLIHCLTTGEAVKGPLDPALCRIGQQIVDTAVQSAQQKRTLPLLG
ncbi:MAG TPA: Gfo/Idh/MocA family oxidoreductase [Chthonomonadaceae bacterium]|nr:Gfo/Idh/MocA family oxidoreductase [Chthonomonadaceae bacterium]